MYDLISLFHIPLSERKRMGKKYNALYRLTYFYPSFEIL